MGSGQQIILDVVVISALIQINMEFVHNDYGHTGVDYWNMTFFKKGRPTFGRISATHGNNSCFKAGPLGIELVVRSYPSWYSYLFGENGDCEGATVWLKIHLEKLVSARSNATKLAIIDKKLSEFEKALDAFKQ